MNNARRLIAEGYISGLHAPEFLTPSQWADRHRIIKPPAPEPGSWKNERTPYLVGIMDAGGMSHPARTVAIMAGTQLGKTQALLNIIMAYVDAQDCSAIIGLPTESEAIKWSARLRPLIEDNPNYIQPDKGKRASTGNTRHFIHWPGVQIQFAWSTAIQTFASVTANLAIGDEVDRWVRQSKEGSPELLFSRRVQNYSRGKVVLASSPTDAGVGIDRAFNAGDKRYYFVPCPKCNWFQVIDFKRIRWPEKRKHESPISRQERYAQAALECAGCSARIEESHKTAMLRDGLWIATRGMDAVVKGGFSADDLAGTQDLRDRMETAQAVSFALPSTYAPFGWAGAAWSQLAREWEATGETPGALRAFINTTMAEPWVDRFEAPEPERIYARSHEGADRYEPGTVNKDVAVLTMYVDVQADRLEWEVMGHGRNSVTWSIDYGVISGSTDNPATWNELRHAMRRRFTLPDGRTLGLQVIGIDTGYRPLLAQQFAEAEPRPLVSPAGAVVSEMGTVILCRGDNQYGSQHIQHYSSYDAANKRGGLYQFFIGTGYVKEIVYRSLRLQAPEPGQDPPPGYAYFPTYRLAYFEGLLSERLSITPAGKKAWEKITASARNEPLDCRVGNLALAALLGIHRWPEQEWAARLSKPADGGRAILDDYAAIAAMGRGNNADPLLKL